MRKNVSLVVLAVFVCTTFTSCVKNWVCTCETTITNNGVVTLNESAIHESQARKVDAQKECSDREGTETATNFSMTTTCSFGEAD